MCLISDILSCIYIYFTWQIWKCRSLTGVDGEIVNSIRRTEGFDHKIIECWLIVVALGGSAGMSTEWFWYYQLPIVQMVICTISSVSTHCNNDLLKIAANINFHEETLWAGWNLKLLRGTWSRQFWTGPELDSSWSRVPADADLMFEHFIATKRLREGGLGNLAATNFYRFDSY